MTFEIIRTGKTLFIENELNRRVAKLIQTIAGEWLITQALLAYTITLHDHGLGLSLPQKTRETTL